MTNTVRFTGTLEDVTRLNKFGFVVGEGYRAFLPAGRLMEAGFSRAELSATTKLVVECEPQERGLCVVTVISLDGVSSKVLAPKQRSLKKRPQKEVLTEPAQVTLAQFINAREIDRNGETGARLIKSCTKDNVLVQYLVADACDVVIRQLGKVTLAEARLAINKVVEPPKVEGKKTNDPALSQQMAASSAGQKGKKAA